MVPTMTAKKTVTPSPALAGDPKLRRTAIIVGALFLVALVLYLVGGLIHGPATDPDHFLDQAYAERTSVVLGILVEFIAVVAIPLIGVFMFPVLRRSSEPLALAYVGFRSFEAVLLILIQTKLLALIEVGRQVTENPNDGVGAWQVAGDLLQAERDTLFQLYVVVFAIGAIILYALLFHMRLVPRWLSVWGLAAAAWMGVGNVLAMFDALPESSASLVEAAIVLPVPLNELVLAGWLIVKGFSTDGRVGERLNA